MRILGIDPGLRVTGYGVISFSSSNGAGRRLSLVEAGVIRSRASDGISGRLAAIHNALSEAIDDLKPDLLVIEKLYAHYKHPTTAILMAHARGVVCLLSGTKKIPLVSLPSTHVKKSIVGQGHAGKAQIQRMVQHHLELERLPEPPDVADALAIAMAYAFMPKNGKHS